MTQVFWSLENEYWLTPLEAAGTEFLLLDKVVSSLGAMCWAEFWLGGRMWKPGACGGRGGQIFHETPVKA